MSKLASARTLVAPIFFGVARVVLGLLWLNEGLLKYRAGFGSADILLVASSADSNSRVPEFFRAFSDFALHGFPQLFGFAMPLIETGLGVLLILGVLTLPAAIASVFTLMTYWSADQLIGEYPIMVALSVVVMAWASYASMFSVSTFLRRRMGRKRAAVVLSESRFARWL